MDGNYIVLHSLGNYHDRISTNVELETTTHDKKGLNLERVIAWIFFLCRNV